jgi:hypothetical protein
MSPRLAMLEKLIAAGSTDPFVHYAHAMELRTLGRAEDALAAFVAVRDRFPDYVPAYLMAGQVAIDLGLRERARELLGQGLVIARQAADGHAESELASALAGLDA